MNMKAIFIGSADAAELYDSEDGEAVGNWRRVAVVEGDDHRWERDMTLVISSMPSRQLYGIDFRVGLTEDQENTYPWDGATRPIELYRMERREVIHVEYRRMRP